jgi:4-hydroxy-3-polyprenylbenzoate decarboxylase
MKRLVVALTGASGAIYGKRLVEVLLDCQEYIDLLISKPAEIVIRQELKFTLPKAGKYKAIREWFSLEQTNEQLCYYENLDYTSPLWSGSHLTKAMVIIPCSMATLSAVANGYSRDLIERAADVTLKEGRPLIMVPRETPLNLLHLQNMIKVAKAGAKLVPAMPGFYHKPESISDLVDFVVGKVLDILDIKHNLYNRWPS